MAIANFSLNISILESINGFKLKSIEPDERGFFPMVIGCLGIPTRGSIVYDIPSTLDAMRDTKSRFNICLKDGNLSGEFGHPVAERREDIPRLLRIDEHFLSHYFGSISVDNEPIMIEGMEAFPIRATVKPTGPYGDFLEKQLRDPYHNTSFSIRTLCLPMTGPNSAWVYRKVQMVITFDAVHAPGYTITSKRYVTGQESFDMSVSREDLERCTVPNGMESVSMITDADIRKMYGEQSIHMNGNLVARDIVGTKSFMDPKGSLRNAASLVYNRR